LIYLDTHVVAWLYVGLSEKFSPTARQLIIASDLLNSPIVQLELQYLHEIHRVTDSATVIGDDLQESIGLAVCDKKIRTVIDKAFEISWTRDPFDRLIIAQAGIDNNLLLTRDQKLLAGYPQAIW